MSSVQDLASDILQILSWEKVVIRQEIVDFCLEMGIVKLNIVMENRGVHCN